MNENDTQKYRLGQETKWQLFYAAIEMMQDKPFDEVRIKDICNKVGVSVGTFYHHYPSKEYLLKEDFDRVDALLQTFIDVLDSTDPIERIIEYASIYSQSAQDSGIEIVSEVYRGWLTMRTSFPTSYKRGALMCMKQLVEEAQVSGQLSSELDAKQLALDILTTCRGLIYHWCQLHGEFDVGAKTAQAVRAMLYYYTHTGDSSLVITRNLGDTDE